MKLRVLVLYGGRSREHEVSCLSARSVLAALDCDRYDVLPVGITREGRWVLTEGHAETPPGRTLPEVSGDGTTVALVLTRKGPRLVHFDSDDRFEIVSEVDVAFPVLHGPYGEDGTIQGLFATLGVPYVGADVTASSVAIDKRAMKSAFKARGLPQVPYRPVRCERWSRERDSVVSELEGALYYPMFTKPARQGSSIGITKVWDRRALLDGLQQSFAYDRVAIVEAGIEGVREIEVGVIGNSEPEVTEPGEVVPTREFYDFEAKYLDAPELVIPADLPEDLTRRVRDLALEAYQAVGCRGMARVDLFLRLGGGGAPYGTGGEAVWVNEINTIPGFTPNSMFPRLWQAQGVSYPQLVDRLLELALDAAHQAARYAP
ncbi:MAG: D-alanine--D-alanine ligase [Actinomycetota bacterium]|nr:D-alanine--D-alanine ligase [Actinomycetota bacterium]